MSVLPEIFPYFFSNDIYLGGSLSAGADAIVEGYNFVEVQKEMSFCIFSRGEIFEC